ncbi:peroxiredoxin [Rhizobium miluonense]|uniref:thioredoxin-dependent peroxiredoxin n=1 Tax=Rhizobium miluonense TaxID=411945 RepID=A0A1C3WQT7_9HYPH|nr:peroxiredoxin [Rhizobium miluonense]SCB42094.1 peroxiredoxin Q/BCP [Rhizobium miluonense]
MTEVSTIQLNLGDKAPDFHLPRDGGGEVRLADFAGKVLVVYFYPKDDTTACTTESISFTALASEFHKAGVAILGVSPDSVKSHDKFVKKHALSVPLASDEEKTMAIAYGVWREKSMYGRTYMGVVRSTFLIGADGRIARIWDKVKVAGHVEDVLAAAKEL